MRRLADGRGIHRFFRADAGRTVIGILNKMIGKLTFVLLLFI